MIAAENDRQGDAGQDGVDAKGNKRKERLNTLERLAMASGILRRRPNPKDRAGRYTRHRWQQQQQQ